MIVIAQPRHEPATPQRDKPSPGKHADRKPEAHRRRASKPAQRKPAAHKPAQRRRPTKPEPKGRKTAGRDEAEILWFDDVTFAPLAKGGHIH